MRRGAFGESASSQLKSNRRTLRVGRGARRDRCQDVEPETYIKRLASHKTDDNYDDDELMSTTGVKKHCDLSWVLRYRRGGRG